MRLAIILPTEGRLRGFVADKGKGIERFSRRHLYIAPNLTDGFDIISTVQVTSIPCAPSAATAMPQRCSGVCGEVCQSRTAAPAAAAGASCTGEIKKGQ